MIKKHLIGHHINNGFFAGMDDGIATLDDKAIARNIVVFNAKTLTVVWHGASFENGRYMVQGLEQDVEYILMIRDYKKDKEMFGYDYIKPSTELTVTEQVQLWQQWQAV